MIEQRKHVRLTPKVHAFTVMRPDFIIVGRVKDISRNGLAFDYLAYEDKMIDVCWSEMDFFIPNSDFCIMQMPCEIIYDIDIGRDVETFIILFTNRRCGVRFRELTEEQEERLLFFLDTYANGDSLYGKKRNTG
jgi:hypothetical protein